MEVEVQFGLGAGLTVVQAEVLLGVPQDELDWEARPVETDPAGGGQLRVAAVPPHPLHRARVGPVRQDMDHPQPALPGAAVQDPVVQVQVGFGPGGAVQARRRVPVEAAVARPAPAACASRSSPRAVSTGVAGSASVPSRPGDGRAQRGKAPPSSGSTAATSVTSNPHCVALAMPFQNQSAPQVRSPLLRTWVASTASAGKRGCGCPAQSAATASRAQGKGRANPRA